MNNASSALKVARHISDHSTDYHCCYFVYFGAGGNQNRSKQFFGYSDRVVPGRFTVYDGTTISGSQVTNALRKYKDKDQFGVL